MILIPDNCGGHRGLGPQALGPCPLLCPRITGARVSEKLDFSTVDGDSPRSARSCVSTDTRGGENKEGEGGGSGGRGCN